MARQPVKKTRVNIYLPESLVNKLDDDANSLGLSRGAVICMYLNRHYENQQTAKSFRDGVELMQKTPNEAIQMIMKDFDLG